jgi:hypothetical protein
MSEAVKTQFERVVGPLNFSYLFLIVTSQAKPLTDPSGWPHIFQEAVIARWANGGSPATPSFDILLPSASYANESHVVAHSVVHSLQQLRSMTQLKKYENILINIQLAASFLGIMSLVFRLITYSLPLLVTVAFQGVVDIHSDIQFRAKLDECFGHIDQSCAVSSSIKTATRLSDLVLGTGLSLVEFQSALFCALTISPIILFRTALLQSSRFGQKHYLPVGIMS